MVRVHDRPPKACVKLKTHMNKAIYLLENKQTPITDADFLKLTSLLESVRGVGISLPADEKNTAYMFYEGDVLSELRPKLNLTTESPTRIELETELTDAITITIVKDVAQKLGMRVYLENLGCYLPKAKYNHDCITFSDKEFFKAQKVMGVLGFTPIFNLEPSDIYYARHIDGSIHIVNDNLLRYLVLLDNTKSGYTEFSYKIADNIEDFVRKFDAELIPTKFYEYYNKSLKIFNYSGLNLENPGRKIFVKPYILEFDNDNLDFFKIAWDNSALLFMDKIRDGEDLDETILRILKDELKIANNYIGAGVSSEVEFDLDKNNILTPRIVVKIYVTKADLTLEQLEKKDRTWISFDQVKDMNKK